MHHPTISRHHPGHISVLYVRLRESYDPPLGKSGLEALTRCPISMYAKVGATAYKIKILTRHLKSVLDNSRPGRYTVDTWKSRLAIPTPTTVIQHPTASTSSLAENHLVELSWFVPYLNSLISEGSDIIVISEHWLWPFELHRLNEIHPDFQGHGQSDSRLSSRAERRGLGGIAMIWRRNLDVSVVHATTSDRICSIRLAEKGSGSTLTVIGVYLPCQDLGIDLYHSCLTNLEQLIRQLGPTVVTCTFGQPRRSQREWKSKPTGFLFHQLVTRSDLYIATLADNASGPSYTYTSGETKTTIARHRCSIVNGGL